MHALAEMHLKVKASGRGKTHYPLTFDPKEPPHAHVVKGGEWRSLNPLPRQDFALLCPGHDY